MSMLSLAFYNIITILDEAEFDVKNYAIGGECYPHMILLEDDLPASLPISKLRVVRKF